MMFGALCVNPLLGVLRVAKDTVLIDSPIRACAIPCHEINGRIVIPGKITLAGLVVQPNPTVFSKT